MRLEPNKLPEKARRFAYLAHMDQFRKYAPHVPYIVHPYRVAAKLYELNGHNNGPIYGNYDMAAAYLHDVVEDCGVTLDTIRKEFGGDVAEAVEALTDPPNESYPKGTNRAMRKAATRERISKARWETQTIKLIDVIDNLSDTWDGNDIGFLRCFLEEADLLLAALYKADKRVRDELAALIVALRAKIDSDN